MFAMRIRTMMRRKITTMMTTKKRGGAKAEEAEEEIAETSEIVKTCVLALLTCRSAFTSLDVHLRSHLCVYLCYVPGSTVYTRRARNISRVPIELPPLVPFDPALLKDLLTTNRHAVWTGNAFSLLCLPCFSLSPSVFLFLIFPLHS